MLPALLDSISIWAVYLIPVSDANHFNSQPYLILSVPQVHIQSLNSPAQILQLVAYTCIPQTLFSSSRASYFPATSASQMSQKHQLKDQKSREYITQSRVINSMEMSTGSWAASISSGTMHILRHVKRLRNSSLSSGHSLRWGKIQMYAHCHIQYIQNQATVQPSIHPSHQSS